MPFYFTGGVAAKGAAGSTAPVAAVGMGARLAKVGTAFAAMLAVEAIFWLIDKLTGGKLSGQAKRIADADPRMMRQHSDEMRALGTELGRSQAELERRIEQLLGLWNGPAGSSAAGMLGILNTDCFGGGVREVGSIAGRVDGMAGKVQEGQETFFGTMKKYEAAITAALAFVFASFMAVVIAGVAVKVIMALLGRVGGEIGSAGSEIRGADAGRIAAIAAAARGPMSCAPPPAMTNAPGGVAPGTFPAGMAAPTGYPPGVATPGAAAPALAAHGLAAPNSALPNVFSASHGWTPVDPPGEGSRGSITVTAKADGSIEVEGLAHGEDCVVTAEVNHKKSVVTIDGDAKVDERRKS